MARKPSKPWFRADRGAWFVCFKGKQVNLGPDQEEAERRFHALLAGRDLPKPILPTTQLLAGLIDQFLEWTQAHRAEATYSWYVKHLQSFLDSLPLPHRFTVDQLKPFHVQQWVDKHKRWGNSYRRGAMIAVQRCLTWAEKLGHIDRSPVRHLEKPPQGKRDTIIPADHYQAILTHTRRNTRDILTFTWETGARPHEIRIIEARHFNAQRQRIEIPPAEAKGKKRWRVIYLTAPAIEIVRRLATKHPTGTLFRNEDGQQWTRDAFNCLFVRLKKHLGVKYSMYLIRHTFATRMLEAGLDHLTVSALLGHADGAMLAKVYEHLDKNHDFLTDKLRTAAGERVSA